MWLPCRTLHTLTGWQSMPTKDLYGLEPLLHRAMAGDGRALDELLAGLRLYMHKQVREQLGPRPDGRINQSDIVVSVCRRFVIHLRSTDRSCTAHPRRPRLSGGMSDRNGMCSCRYSRRRGEKYFAP